MKSKTNIILLVLFFAGLLGLWWARSARIPTERERERLEGLVLTDLRDTEVGDVRRVEIDGGPKPLAFERRDDGTWQMTEPVDALADRSRVENLVRTLKDLRRLPGSGPITDRPAESFGLEPPARTVRLFAGDAKTPVAILAVGKPVRDQRYVRPEGERGVEAVDARLIAAVDLPADDWREHALFLLSTFDVKALAVQGPGRDLQAERGPANDWRLVRPVPALADGQKLEGVLADLIALRVADGDRGFVANDVRDLSKYGLEPPQLKIALTPQSDGKPQVLRVGQEVPGKSSRAFAVREGQDDVVMIDDSTIRALGTEPNALRSQKVANIDPARIEAIELQEGQTTHLVVRDKVGWRVLKPHEAKADDSALQALAGRLGDLQTSEFLDASQVPKPGVDPPALVLRVWQAEPTAVRRPSARMSKAAAEPEGRPQLVLRLGRHDVLKKTVFGQLEHDPTLLAFPDNLLTALPTGPLAFRDRTLLALSPGQIDRIVLRRGGRTFVVEAPANPTDVAHWKLTRPVQAPADPDTVRGLTTLLAGLRAEKLFTDRPADRKTYGLDAPALTVSWRLKPEATAGARGPDELTLAVGGPVPGDPATRYATLSGNPIIFSLGPGTLALLDMEPRDRRLLTFAPEEADRVVLRWPDGRTATFALQARPTGGPPVWQAEAGRDASGKAADRIGPLVTMLGRLAAVRYVQYEGPFPAALGLDPPRLAIEVRLKAGAGRYTLRVGESAPDGSRFATTAEGSQGPVALVAGTEWNAWIAPPATPPELPEDVFGPAGPR